MENKKIEELESKINLLETVTMVLVGVTTVIFMIICDNNVELERRFSYIYKSIKNFQDV